MGTPRDENGRPVGDSCYRSRKKKATQGGGNRMCEPGYIARIRQMYEISKQLGVTDPELEVLGPMGGRESGPAKG